MEGDYLAAPIAEPSMLLLGSGLAGLGERRLEVAPHVAGAELGRRAQMTLLITLILLACAPVVTCYLLWGFEFARGVTADDPHQAASGRGERTMPSGMAGPDGERVIRWMDEGRTVFESVRRILGECDQLKEAAGAAQKECQRLRQHCEV